MPWGVHHNKEVQCIVKVFSRNTPITDRWALRTRWAVFAFGALYLGLCFLHRFPAASAETDGIDYLLQARDMLRGHIQVYTGYHGPGYPTAIAVVGVLLRDLFLSAKLISVVSAVGLLVATGRVATALAGSRVAFLSVVFLGLNPALVRYSFAALSDVFGAVLFWSAMMVWASALDSRRRNLALWAGCVAGLAYVSRYVNIVLLVLPLAAVVLRRERRTVMQAACYFGGFALLAAPLLISTWLATGTILGNENYRNVAAGLYGWGRVGEFHSLADVIVESPAFFIKSYLLRLGFELPRKLLHFTGYVALFWAPGLMLLARRCCTGGVEPDRRLHLASVLATGATAFLALQLTGWIEPRFLLPVMPVLAIATAYMVASDEVLDVCWNKTRGARCAALVAAVIALSCVVPAAKAVRDMFSREAPEFVSVGHSLASLATQSDLLVVSQEHIAWFADRPWFKLTLLPESLFRGDAAPREWRDAVGRRCRDIYVVVDDRYAVTKIPALAPLACGVGVPGRGFQLVRVAHTARTCAVYRLPADVK